ESPSEWGDRRRLPAGEQFLQRLCETRRGDDGEQRQMALVAKRHDGGNAEGGDLPRAEPSAEKKTNEEQGDGKLVGEKRKIDQRNRAPLGDGTALGEVDPKELK